MTPILPSVRPFPTDGPHFPRARVQAYRARGWLADEWEQFAYALDRLLRYMIDRQQIYGLIRGELRHRAPPAGHPHMGDVGLELEADVLPRDVVAIWMEDPTGFAAPVLSITSRKLSWVWIAARAHRCCALVGNNLFKQFAQQRRLTR